MRRKSRVRKLERRLGAIFLGPEATGMLEATEIK